MKKILLTGSNGMLAHDFIRTQWARFEIIWLSKTELDITNMQAVETRVQEIGPDIILNCAAYTNVDEAEDVGRKVNFEINTLGVFNLATVANKYQKDFITISTDYVFDGSKEDGYSEADIPNPINNYGLAKYLGEKIAHATYPNSIIIRTSWLYGGGMAFKNFVNTMLKLSESKSDLNIINDQFWSPTYTVDLAQGIGEIIEDLGNFRGKILHLSNGTPANGISWFDFAEEIFQVASKKMNLTPCVSEEYKTKALRPKFSKLQNHQIVSLQEWRSSLAEYLKQLEK